MFSGICAILYAKDGDIGGTVGCLMCCMVEIVMEAVIYVQLTQ